MVTETFRSPSKLRLFLPYSIYILMLFGLIWCTISLIPIIMLFLCTFHFLVNTYFSYFFYVSVKISYAHVLSLHKNMQFMNDAYSQMHQQIKQIRLIYLLASLSSLISAFVNCSFTLCGTLRLVPFGLCINSIFLYLMFTKNRLFMKSTLCCKCKVIHKQIKQPFTILKKRRESPWAPPTTLAKIKISSAHSLKALRGLPGQLTPKFIRTASAPNLKQKVKICFYVYNLYVFHTKNY